MKKKLRKAAGGVLTGVVLLATVLLPVLSAQAVTVYESDGEFHEEGYIFIGESHIGNASTSVGAFTNGTGIVPGVADVNYYCTWDDGVKTESGTANRFIMKGNLYFVFEGASSSDRGTQAAKEYIYSDGKGKMGKAVEKVHAIIDGNPNIAHWNIILYQGSAQAKIGGNAIADYYVKAYRNWIDYEFPEADIYFLSHSTMTKYYKGCKDPDVLNNALQNAFPETYFDYTEFYNERYPQGMWDPTLKSDTNHWSPQVNFELITSVIQEIQELNTSVQYTITEVEAVLYTNDAAVIYAQPSLKSNIILPACEAGIPVLVTGVTDNGYFRVDLGEADGYVMGNGLQEQWE